MTAAISRTLAVTAAIAVSSLLMFVGASWGAAETGTFPIHDRFSESEDDSASCLGPTAVGTVTGTATGAGRFTENGPPAFGFHDHGTASVEYRVQYIDGRYTLGTAVNHFDDNATHQGQLESTGIDIHDYSTLYGPDGQSLGPVTFLGILHITFRDANGNRQPDPGEVTAHVDHVRITCS